MIDINKMPYRLGVGIMLLNKNSQVFVGRRIDTTSDTWQMPQGGIDDGEEPNTAALRELEEETGVNKVEIISTIGDWFYYDLPIDLIPKIWKGKYRGQKQKWIAIKFLGSDADINIETKYPEFCEWKWVEIQELPGLIVPFKTKMYQDIVDIAKKILV